VRIERQGSQYTSYLKQTLRLRITSKSSHRKDLEFFIVTNYREEKCKYKKVKQGNTNKSSSEMHTRKLLLVSLSL
jgi:hypothetical protein